ncbi:hypothetical protein, partial [Thermoflexus hugenholtzii]
MSLPGILERPFPSAQGLDLFRVGLFPDHGQRQSLAPILFARLDEQIGGAGVLHGVVVRGPIAHDEGTDRVVVFVEEVWPSVNGHIHLAVGVSGGQNPDALGLLEVFSECHKTSPERRGLPA